MDRLQASPPDIEEALRNPANEYAYREAYNKRLAERAMSAIDSALEGKGDQKEILRLLFEGNESSTIVDGKVAKALSEAGMLRISEIVSEKPPENKGWFEKSRMEEWEKQVGHEVWGVVRKYYIQLPEKEAEPPVTSEVVLEVRQPKLEGVENRYGGPMWGDIDYDKWTIARTSM
jgi:hypothetical protein